jgi:hypothetical protein
MFNKIPLKIYLALAIVVISLMAVYGIDRVRTNRINAEIEAKLPLIRESYRGKTIYALWDKYEIRCYYETIDLAFCQSKESPSIFSFRWSLKKNEICYTGPPGMKEFCHATNNELRYAGEKGVVAKDGKTLIYEVFQDKKFFN